MSYAELIDRYRHMHEYLPTYREIDTYYTTVCIPWWLRWNRIHQQCGRPGFDPWVEKIPWRRAW